MQLCEFGRKVDENDCETNECLPRPFPLPIEWELPPPPMPEIPDMCEGEACECPEGMFGVQPFCEMCPPVTMQFCPFGREVDPNGCETSNCLPMPSDFDIGDIFGFEPRVELRPELEELADGEIRPELVSVLQKYRFTDQCMHQTPMYALK